MEKIMKSFYCLLLIIIAIQFSASAQNARIDSITALMNSPAGDSLSDDASMKNYLIIASSNIYSNFEQTIVIARKALIIARRIPNQRGEAMALNFIGIGFSNQSSHDSALSYYHKAQDILLQIHDTVGIIHTYNNMGIVYNNNGNYQQSVHNYSHALEMARSQHNYEMMAFSINNLAIVYYEWQQFPLAMEYYDQSLALIRQLGDSAKIAVLLNNIGELYVETGKQEEALKNFQEALSISQQSNSPKTTMNARLNIGDYYLLKRNFNDAQNNYFKALEIGEANNYPLGIVGANIKLAQVLIETATPDEALPLASEGLRMALKLQNQKLIIDARHILYLIYQKKGDFRESLNQFVAYTELQDTLFNKNSRKEIARLRTEYETEKKEKEIVLLNQDKAIQSLEIGRQKSLRIYTTLLAVFILLAGYLMYNRYRLRQKNIKTELERMNVDIEQRLLRSQMSPHFIFNSLNSINSFIVKNDTKSAQLFLTKFSELIRLILENSRKSMISIEDEIKTLQLNLEIEQLRFNDRFDFEIITGQEIDVANTYIPPMLVQPFVENALIHGILHKKEKGLISIRFNMQSSAIHAIVKDNGVGREKARTIEHANFKTHESLGLQLTKERLLLLGKKSNNDYQYTITDLTDDNEMASGTLIDVLMPCEVE
jgi:tetratricopeptide (TPR) repeat protein